MSAGERSDVCGIVGVVGDRPAAPLILEALRALEYRGYDSAGLAVLGPEGIQIRRRAGKLDGLAELVAHDAPAGSLGIGHTRWATHGAVTDANAHPHRDASGTIALVHNGILDNFAELKARLVAAGHRFVSETDTEVIAHVIGEARERGADLPAAMRSAMGQLQGAHALLALAADAPDQVVAARVGTAGGLVVGFTAQGALVASDLPAVVRYTRQVQFLEPGDVAVVRRGRAEFRPLEGAPVERPITPIPWDPVAAAKGGFKHFLAKEIHEQPETLASAIRPRIRLDPPDVHLEDFQLPVPAERIARVMLVASGTAGYAGLIGRRYMEEIAGIPAEAEIASEFAYRPLPIAPDTLVVAISQSGETADVLLAMAAAKAHGAAVVGVVNAVGSEATRRADAVVYTHAGPEISVASTKAFSSQVACLYLLACYLGRARGVLSDGRLAQLLGDLAQVPALAVAVLRCEGQMEAIARHFHRARDFLFIGRGIEYPLALEGALKLKELSYIHAEGYAAGELKHGPISLVDEEVPVVALATRSRVREKTLNAVEQVRARDGQVILIATEGDERAATLARHLVTLPATSELIAPMLAILPLQLLAYRMAVWLGCDVDQPRNLAKSVTVE